jgi:hypothetical protein
MQRTKTHAKAEISVKTRHIMAQITFVSHLPHTVAAPIIDFPPTLAAANPSNTFM